MKSITVAVFTPDPEDAADVRLRAHTLDRAITEICDGVGAEPSRYPSLACVRVIGQMSVLDRDALGFTAIGRRLSEAGLVFFVDGCVEQLDDESDDGA